MTNDINDIIEFFKENEIQFHHAKHEGGGEELVFQDQDLKWYIVKKLGGVAIFNNAGKDWSEILAEIKEKAPMLLKTGSKGNPCSGNFTATHEIRSGGYVMKIYKEGGDVKSIDVQQEDDCDIIVDKPKIIVGKNRFLNRPALMVKPISVGFVDETFAKKLASDMEKAIMAMSEFGEYLEKNMKNDIFYK